MQKIILLAMLAISMTACVNNHQNRAATSGGVIGAAAGAAIGSSHNRVVEGAVIGGILGAATGVVLEGNRRKPQAHHPQSRSAPAHVQKKHRNKHKKKHDDDEDED